MQKSSHPIKKMFAIRLLAVVLLTNLWSVVTAQDINYAACGAVNPITKTVGTDPAISIGVTGTPGGAPATVTIFTITFDDGSGFPLAICGGFGGPCGTSVPVNGVTVNATAIPVTIGGGTLTATGTIHVVLIAESDGVQCQATYDITVQRKPVDVMLVLDNSPSMNCCTNIDDETCVTCGDPSLVRMTKLKQAVDIFFSVGSSGNYFLPTDKFGAVIFSGTIDNSHSAYVTDPAPLNTYIQGISTSGGTCIGGGLLEGVNQMTTQSAADRAKSLILFTDGEQNYNPMLDDSSLPVQFEAGDLPTSPYDPAAPNPPYGTCMTFPASPPTFNTAFRDETPGIKISTIGFKLPAGASGIMLTNLANSTSGAGGTTNIGTGIEFEFEDFFLGAFEELLSGNSPQIVKRTSGVTTGGLNTVQFVTNDTVAKVTFILAGSEGDRNSLRFKVMKNNQDVTRAGKIVDKGSYRLWHVNFPIRKPTGPAIGLTPGGTWTLQTSDTNAGVHYRATCMVDDHRLDYTCDLGDPSKHAPGKPIPLSVSIRYKGNPVDSAQKVIVIIERNTGEGGTLLSTLAIPEKLKSFTSINGQESNPVYNNLGQVKHALLLQSDASYASALTRVMDTVVLTNNHDGTYTNKYIPKVTGTYKFTFLIDGQQADIGTYQREKVVSSVVKVMHFDLSKNNFLLERVLDGEVFAGYRLKLTLKDSAGVYLGPAFGRAIDLKSTLGTVGAVTDNLDGSYSVLLAGVNEGADPVLDISIYGVPVFAGNVSALTGSHACPSWIPGFLANLFHMLGLSCIVGLIILIVLIAAIIFWLIRRKK